MRVVVFAFVFCLFSCTDHEFNNPHDPDSPNYESLSSSSSATDASSSSSELSSSSSVADASSSSNVTLSSSSSSSELSSSSSLSVMKITCGESTINTQTHFCYDGKAIQKCSDMEYNPTTDICYGGAIYEAKCNNVPFNPLEQRCENNVIEAKCGKEWYKISEKFCDSRDNKIYGYTKINTQIWMAENLNYDTKSDGSNCYRDSVSYCDKYGRLYQWHTADTVCPKGWHLPSADDWNILLSFFSNCSGNRNCNNTGNKLKYNGNWEEATSESTNDYNFSALPGGGYYSDRKVYDCVGLVGVWWSSEQYNSEKAYTWAMRSIDDDVSGSYTSKSDFFSIRCVKD